MKGFYALALALLTMLFSSCIPSRYTIADYYTVYRHVDGEEGPCLVCKLGCERDAKICNVSHVWWSKRTIVVKQQGASNNAWFLVHAREVELTCCNRDTTL